MQVARITATFFTSLITRLGIQPPFSEGFLMSNTVQPVSIVDSDIVLTAVTTSITQGNPYTAGELAAPAANTVNADTGAQAAGNYAYRIQIAHNVAANVNYQWRIERRDAANAANIWGQIVSFWTAGTAFQDLSGTLTLAAGERLRVINVSGPLGLTVQASIWLVRT